MEKIKRRKMLFIIANIVAGIFSLVLFILAWNTSPEYILFIGIFVFMWIIVAVIWYREWIKFPFKLDVVKPIIESISKKIKYNYSIRYTLGYKSIIKEYNLISYATSFDFNDEIQDEVEGIKYTSFDLTASHQVGSGKSSHTEIDFQGKVYDIELGKTYCDFILKEDGSKLKAKGFEKLDLESIEMNEKFDLYTNNLVEIHKIFTPRLIMRCRDLDFFQNKQSMICYLDTHLYIFLANKENQFEKLTSKEEIEQEYYTQLSNLKKYLSLFL
ncbi:MAG: DUF3137 domain-containing protein [Anaeroplasmataceae bacterium]|nr:DUF3137 domain-containing protein [Anaeroplasmataceae bacterium]